MDNDNYITLNEQGLAEISPTASSEMQQAFIDTYRQTQGEKTAQIGEQAHALGSDLEAQYGGLHGPSEYIKSRYQTPQTESRIANLRTAAQLSALNQILQNEQARWKDKYSQAYRDAQKRQRARQKAAATTSGSGGNTPYNIAGQEDITTNILEEKDVTEDAFFKRQEQENLYNELMQKQAAARGMSVEEYANALRKAREAGEQGTIDLGIGSFNTTTNTFNNGLGI